MAVNAELHFPNGQGGFNAVHPITVPENIRGLDFYDLVPDGAGQHNALYREKDLTAYFNSGEMSAAIADGSFKDIFPGDYIIKSVTVDGVAYNDVKWIIGDLDYHLNKGDQQCTEHHVLTFPEITLGTAKMNATNTTNGGFEGSAMWRDTLPLYAAGIKAAFGSGHVLKHKTLITNTVNASAASGAGAGWNGSATNFAWYDAEVNLMTEPMVYGGKILSSSFFDIGDGITQVAAFRHKPSLQFSQQNWYWLRAVVSSTYFAHVGYGGNANANYASNNGGVRPYFLLY